MTDQAPSPDQVRRRAVFYIPGFDPVPPRSYRERYRREAARQVELSAHSITVSPMNRAGGYGWHVAARIEGAETVTDIELLHWADIVRASMSGGIVATYGQLLRTARVYLASGALFRLMRLRKGPLIAALYPVGFLLVQLALALSGSASSRGGRRSFAGSSGFPSASPLRFWPGFPSASQPATCCCVGSSPRTTGSSPTT